MAIFGGVVSASVAHATRGAASRTAARRRPWPDRCSAPSGSPPPGTTCAPSPSPAPRAGRPAPRSAPGSIARSRTRPTASTRSGAPTRRSGSRASSRRSSARTRACCTTRCSRRSRCSPTRASASVRAPCGSRPATTPGCSGSCGSARRSTPGRRPSSPPSPTDDDGLSTTFESVRQRFARMGLAVNWHGAGHLALPRETLDALLGALGECLENVRRHSGVNEADVTVTDDDRTVRAMITDAGQRLRARHGRRRATRLRRVGRRPPQHGGRTRADLLVARLRDDRDARGAEAMTDRAPRSARPEHAFRRPAPLGAHRPGRRRRAREPRRTAPRHGHHDRGRRSSCSPTSSTRSPCCRTTASASARGPRGSRSRRSWRSASSRDSCRACCPTGSTSCSWRAWSRRSGSTSSPPPGCWTTASCRPPPRRRERC